MYAHTWHVTFTRWVFFFEFHVIFFSPFPIQLFYTCLVSCNSFIFSDSFFFLYDYSIFTWSIYSYKLFFVKLTWFVHFHVIKNKTKKTKQFIHLFSNDSLNFTFLHTIHFSHDVLFIDSYIIDLCPHVLHTIHSISHVILFYFSLHVIR